MARFIEISFNSNFKSIKEFKDALKDALISLPEGTLRIATWYDRPWSTSLQILSVQLQSRCRSALRAGIDIKGVERENLHSVVLTSLKEVKAELQTQGIYVMPRVFDSWQAD